VVGELTRLPSVCQPKLPMISHFSDPIKPFCTPFSVFPLRRAALPLLCSLLMLSKKATDLCWFQTLVISESMDARAPASRAGQSAGSGQVRGREGQHPAAGTGGVIQPTSLHLHSPGTDISGASPGLGSSQPRRGVPCRSKCPRVKYFTEQDVQCPPYTTAVNIQSYSP